MGGSQYAQTIVDSLGSQKGGLPNSRFRPGGLPELEQISRLQRSVPQEEIAPLEGTVNGITTLLSSFTFQNSALLWLYP